MNRVRYICFLLWISCTFGVAALEVETCPGELRGWMGDAAVVRELVVKGAMDVRDFEFIASEMTGLRHLDLGQVTVAAYQGESAFRGEMTSAEGVLPECGLMCPLIETVVLPRNLVEIADGALGGSGVVSLTIPEGVRKIGNSAFGNCRSLETVIVPANVRELGRNVFKGCESLRSVTIADGLSVIPAGTFAGCHSLSDVRLPGSLEAIGEGAFAGCTALARVEFSESLTDIGDRAFAASGLEMADFSRCAGLKRIGRWAFASSAALAEVRFGNSVVELDDGAFFNDAFLAPGGLPASLSTIGDFSLYGIDASDGRVIAATGVESLGAYSMAGWRNVREIILPSSLAYMGDGAMSGWMSLERMSAEELSDVPALGKNVWGGVNQEAVTLVVPAESVDAYRNAPQWKDFDIIPAGVSDISVVTDGSSHPSAPAVTARFEGAVLILEASEPISALFISDLQGRGCTFPVTDPGSRIMVNTAAWNSPILLLRLTLADGNAHTIKIHR